MVPKFIKHIVKKVYCAWYVYHKGLFDSEWYRKRYPEVNKSWLPVYFHYLKNGHKLEYYPSEIFSPLIYAAYHQDLLYREKNYLVHFAMNDCWENLKLYHTNMESVVPALYDTIECEPSHKKKILLISHESSLTGAPRALLNLAICLKKQDVLPYILTLKPGSLDAECEKQGILHDFISPSLFFSNSANGNKLREELIKSIDLFDIILFNTIVAVPLIKSISMSSPRKYCWIHDGSVAFEGWSKMYNLTEIFNDYDRIFAVGNYTIDLVKSYSKGEIQVENLLYGIDDILRDSKLDNINPYWPIEGDEHKLKFILAGTIESRKGQKILLDALNFLPAEILEDMSFVLVGGICDKEVEQNILKSKKKCVHYLGVVNHQTLLSYMRKTDVLLCPSLDDPMPIVCTEAFMLSKPVIAGTNTGTASLIRNEKNGFVTVSGNARSLANNILKVYRMRDELEEIGRNGRKIYDEWFTMEVFSKNVRRIFVKEPVDKQNEDV